MEAEKQPVKFTAAFPDSMVLIFGFDPEMPSRSRVLELPHFLRKKKNSFNSENGGVDEFEKVFSPCVFSDLPSPELHPSSVRIINPTHNLLWMLPPPCFMDII